MAGIWTRARTLARFSPNQARLPPRMNKHSRPQHVFKSLRNIKSFNMPWWRNSVNAPDSKSGPLRDHRFKSGPRRLLFYHHPNKPWNQLMILSHMPDSRHCPDMQELVLHSKSLLHSALSSNCSVKFPDSAQYVVSFLYPNI